MLNRESSRSELVLDDIGCNLNTIEYNATLSKQKIPPSFEDMFPVFITREVIVANMEI